MYGRACDDTVLFTAKVGVAFSVMALSMVAGMPLGAYLTDRFPRQVSAHNHDAEQASCSLHNPYIYEIACSVA